MKSSDKSALSKSIVAMAIIVLFAATICPQQAQDLPNDIKWVTQSVEYAALCVQTYRAGWWAVKEAAQQQTEDWAVVLDVDETVLDNSQYAVERAAVDSGYTEQSWAEWVFRKEATLIPGAKAFIDSVRTLGPKAHVAYITNRKFEHEQATIENLQKYGLFKEDDIMLTRKGPEDTKEKRRQCVREGTGRCEKHGPLKIIALFGDNIHDFFPVYSMTRARVYREETLPADPHWGREYFMLPNPTYGSWERDYQ